MGFFFFISSLVSTKHPPKVNAALKHSCLNKIQGVGMLVVHSQPVLNSLHKSFGCGWKRGSCHHVQARWPGFSNLIAGEGQPPDSHRVNQVLSLKLLTMTLRNISGRGEHCDGRSQRSGNWTTVGLHSWKRRICLSERGVVQNFTENGIFFSKVGEAIE